MLEPLLVSAEPMLTAHTRARAKCSRLATQRVWLSTLGGFRNSLHSYLVHNKGLGLESYLLIHFVSEISDDKNNLPLRDQTDNIKIQFTYYYLQLEL